MPIRNRKPITFKAVGCSDTFDGTNSFPGAMQQLSNLIPAPNAMDAWVPRPASVQLTNFSSFTTPQYGEALFNNGIREYGFIQSARFAGKSEPFIFDLLANAFIPIAGVTAANLPNSTLNGGDWVPPTIDRDGAFVIFTHPGFDGTTHFFGWLDMTSFSSSTITGSTHTTTTVDTFSANVVTAGWRPGMLISDGAGDIPANTTIVSINAAGTSLTLSAPATGSNAGTTFTVTGGSFTAPLWAAGNTLVHPLVAVPTCVAQYAGSACYGVNTPTSSAVVFSDAGDPLIQTNANQVVTFANVIPVTALCGQPLNNVTGGVLKSLMAFQSTAVIQQITGAPATSDLAINTLNDTTGTLAPNTIQATPKGILFAAPDGVRRIDLFGNIRQVVGRRGMGVSTPFMFAVHPSRMCAAYNEGVYRISVQNGTTPDQTFQEWWYHEEDDRWSGPHTFPAALISATEAPHSFVMFAIGVPAALWHTDCQPDLASTYVENGTQLSWTWQTSLLPDNGQAAMNAILKTTLAIALPSGQMATVTFTDDFGNTLDSVNVSTATPPADSTWDITAWDAPSSVWDGLGTAIYRQRTINWSAPWVYKQATIMVRGNSAYDFRIGDLFMINEPLGYDRLEPTG